jgi:hypothetical protein
LDDRASRAVFAGDPADPLVATMAADPADLAGGATAGLGGGVTAGLDGAATDLDGGTTGVIVDWTKAPDVLDGKIVNGSSGDLASKSSGRRDAESRSPSLSVVPNDRETMKIKSAMTPRPTIIARRFAGSIDVAVLKTAVDACAHCQLRC